MKLDDPRSWIHPQHCECEACTPYHPAVPARLTWVDLARLGTLGLVAGIAASAALAPMRTIAALASLVQ